MVQVVVEQHAYVASGAACLLGAGKPSQKFVLENPPTVRLAAGLENLDARYYN